MINLAKMNGEVYCICQHCTFSEFCGHQRQIGGEGGGGMGSTDVALDSQEVVHNLVARQMNHYLPGNHWRQRSSASLLNTEIVTVAIMYPLCHP